jgi:hypothetical protein
VQSIEEGGDLDNYCEINPKIDFQHGFLYTILEPSTVQDAAAAAYFVPILVNPGFENCKMGMTDINLFVEGLAPDHSIYGAGQVPKLANNATSPGDHAQINQRSQYLKVE